MTRLQRLWSWERAFWLSVDDVLVLDNAIEHRFVLDEQATCCYGAEPTEERMMMTSVHSILHRSPSTTSKAQYRLLLVCTESNSILILLSDRSRNATPKRFVFQNK